MAFHTILKTSKDYYSALRWARRLTDRLETAINANLTDDQVRVPRRPEISLKSRTKCLWHPSFSFEGSRPRLVGVQLIPPLLSPVPHRGERTTALLSTPSSQSSPHSFTPSYLDGLCRLSPSSTSSSSFPLIGSHLFIYLTCLWLGGFPTVPRRSGC